MISFRTFLSFSFFIFVAFLLLFFLFFHFFILSILLILFSSLIIFFFRKENVLIKEGGILANEILVSPISGHLKKIELLEEKKIISLSLPWWKSWGIYLPITSSFKEIHAGKTSILKLVSKSGDEFIIEISSFLTPRFYALAGDRGKSGANIGYCSLGGEIKITLPETADLLVKKGDRLKAGETLLVGKENYEQG